MKTGKLTFDQILGSKATHELTHATNAASNRNMTKGLSQDNAEFQPVLNEKLYIEQILKKNKNEKRIVFVSGVFD